MADDRQRASQLERELQVFKVKGNWGEAIVRLAREGRYDLFIMALPPERSDRTGWPGAEWIDQVLDHAHCDVYLAARLPIPKQVDEG